MQTEKQKMESTVGELNQIVSDYSRRMAQISESDFSHKPLPGKWSKKEVVGHLIDSAQNNLRRFVAGQYEGSPPKITYEQDFWVKAANYQNRKSSDVIELWKLMNDQVCAVLIAIPPENYTLLADTGKNVVQTRSLQWLADDYVKHLKHHINQVIPKSFDIVYP